MAPMHNVISEICLACCFTIHKTHQAEATPSHHAHRLRRCAGLLAQTARAISHTHGSHALHVINSSQQFLLIRCVSRCSQNASPLRRPPPSPDPLTAVRLSYQAE